MKSHLRSRRNSITAWCMYDWANSGYTTLLITVFVIYIQRVVFADRPIFGAIIWAWSIALSMLVGAVLSPFAGALADAYGGKRVGLAISAFGGGLCCMLMGLAPSSSTWLIVGLLVLANLGLELSLTFYNGFLPEITDESEINQISSRGFAVGYFGGGLALLTAILFLNFNQSFEMTTRLRICIFATGLWWILFSIPAIAGLADKPRHKSCEGILTTCQKSCRETFGTLRCIRATPVLFWFLIAFLIYNDGIQTVISQASTFALQELEFSETGLVSVVLMIQFVATPGAIFIGWAADTWSRKSALMGCLVIWILLLVSAWFIHHQWQFWALAFGVALVLGGTQSVSRAIMGSLTPQGEEARYFGFFNLSGKATSFLGTFFFGAVVAVTGSSRVAIVGLLFFFIIGLLIVVYRLKIESKHVTGTPLAKVAAQGTNNAEQDQ